MAALEPVTLETLEAKTRRLMSERARIEDRGYDTARARQVYTRQIDALLDAWNAANCLLAHEFEASA